jgi:hypothetical protein
MKEDEFDEITKATMESLFNGSEHTDTDRINKTISSLVNNLTSILS